jgi:hypothetical protein
MADNYRVPRGYAVRHPQYQEIMEGQRPTIKDLKAAPYLPVAEIEPRHDDPIVIPAGTWVGIVGGSAVGAGDSDTGSLADTVRYMVPACASYYTLTYSNNDINDTFGILGKVKDLDQWTTAARTGGTVTAAGASTEYVGNSGAVWNGVKPIGIVYQDVYASWLNSSYVNYERQPSISLLTRDYVVQVPAVTTNERAIEPGDLVMVDGFGATDATWYPAATATGDVATMKPGHIARVSSTAFTETGVAGIKQAFAAQEFIVGRCLRKILVAEYGDATANSKLSANIADMTRANVSTEFSDAGRVQTVPGLSLQGSGLKGVPAWARNATADSNGKFWLLEIHVGAC